MPSYPHIERYYAEKRRLIDFGGSDSEQNIRRAFENCLDSYCRDHREGFALVAPTIEASAMARVPLVGANKLSG